jgi:hypothetical protein
LSEVHESFWLAAAVIVSNGLKLFNREPQPQPLERVNVREAPESVVAEG